LRVCGALAALAWRGQISKLIGENFGFLYNVRGRVVFLVLIGFMCVARGNASSRAV
jgi:hypothetical protein